MSPDHLMREFGSLLSALKQSVWNFLPNLASAIFFDHSNHGHGCLRLSQLPGSGEYTHGTLQSLLIEAG